MSTLPTTAKEAIAARDSLQVQYDQQQLALSQINQSANPSEWAAQDALLTSTGNKISLANLNINNLAVADKTNRSQIVSSGSGSIVKVIDVPPSQSINNATVLKYSTSYNIAESNYSDSLGTVSNLQGQGLIGTDVYEAAKIEAFNAEEERRTALENLDFARSNSLQDDTEYSDIPIVGDLTEGALTVDDGSNVTDLLEQNGSVDEGNDPIVVTARAPPDMRIRIRAKLGQESTIYGPVGSSVMSQLHETEGVFFPYTPTITYNHSVNYSPMTPTHANTDYWLYTNTPSVQFQISGQFSAQNQQEAQYLLASMHFFRTVTKMRFGEDDDQRGLPPPVVVLSGYGNFMFNDLNVIVTNFSMDLASDVDYIQVDIGDSVAWVPALTTFNLTVVVQHTPAQQRLDFNWDRFASGEMFSNGKGWI